MGTSISFSKAAEKFTFTFGPDLSEITVQQNMEMISNFAIQAGINLHMTRSGHDVHFNLDSVADCLVMRDQVATWEQSQPPTHTETLTPPNKEYQAAWVYQVQKTLKDAQIPYELDEIDNKIHLTFKSFGAFSLFTALRNTNYFGVKAQTMLNLEGSPPSSFEP